MLHEIDNAKIKRTIHGVTKSEVLNRQADGQGSNDGGILTVPSRMPPENPFFLNTKSKGHAKKCGKK